MILLASKIALNKTTTPVPASAANLAPHAYQVFEANQEYLAFKGKKKKKRWFFPNTVFTQIYSIFLTWQRKSLMYQNALSSQQAELLSTQKCSRDSETYVEKALNYLN